MLQSPTMENEQTSNDNSSHESIVARLLKDEPVKKAALELVAAYAVEDEGDALSTRGREMAASAEDRAVAAGIDMADVLYLAETYTGHNR